MSTKINLHEMFEKLINRYDENEMCSQAWKKFGVGKENGAYKVGFIDASFAKSEEIKAALNDLQGKVDGLVAALENIKWMGYPEQKELHQDLNMYRCTVCDSAEKATQALAEFKKERE